MASTLPFDVDLSIKPNVEVFFEPRSCTLSYLVIDPNSNACAVIDSAADMDYAAGRITYESADKIIEKIKHRSLSLEWIIETHVHADHLSAAPYIQSQIGGKIAISREIAKVQGVFADVFNEDKNFQRQGEQFDYLFEHGETYYIGSMKALAILTPGHTPACMTHVVGDAAFVGDTLFMPDSGTARADFPGGDAKTLYASIQSILSLPNEMRLFTCHDYQPGGRELQYQSSVAEQKQQNIHLKDDVSEARYVELRKSRDATLNMPNLIIPSIQVNMRAGHLPKKSEENDTAYLKVPINRL
ncbi:MBL fold metallo-hydrolase [Alteromonadaceae bacterium M269]|nr:MBL fold metallo-hydrolase [Alteromonadaceae bacterium M269]